MSKFFIDQKLFEFKREKEKWWRITESSQRVMKYISIDVEAMAWLVSTVRECAAVVGFSLSFLELVEKGIKCWWCRCVTITMAGIFRYWSLVMSKSEA